jgi:hypothetical protein
MSQTKFTAHATFETNLVQGFAEYLGYDAGKLENETHEEYISRRLKEHVNLFSTQWANARVNEMTETYKKNLEAQIIKPIKDSTIVEVENII